MRKRGRESPKETRQKATPQHHSKQYKFIPYLSWTLTPENPLLPNGLETLEARGADTLVILEEEKKEKMKDGYILQAHLAQTICIQRD